MVIKKTLSILGVTGTIGQNCLKVLGANPGRFDVVALTAHDNVEVLAKAVIETGASFAAIGNPEKYAQLKTLLSGTKVELAAGEDGLLHAASLQSDIVLAAIVGAAGLKPTLKAVERGATIALANKECLVSAGALFMQAARTHGAKIIPVDSEHNAIFQILQNTFPPFMGGYKREASELETASTHQTPTCLIPALAGRISAVRKITLTASGGPFRNWTLEQMRAATPMQAVKHPNWHMGAKISVDSATMVNKGLELIEAMHLFNVAPDVLDVLVHPESIIHGLVEMTDGSVLAQMSEPDMCIPIAYALGFPEKLESTAAPLNLGDIGRLTFEPPDVERFPALNLAKEAMIQGPAAQCAFNAANEVAVEAFLNGQIGFTRIAEIIDMALQNVSFSATLSLENMLEIDQWVRNFCIPSFKKFG